MSSLFFRRTRTKHERKLAMLSARFRQKPRQNPDPFATRVFNLTHIGNSFVDKSKASGLGGVHRVLLDYYLSFLRCMTREELSLDRFGQRNPANRRILTIKKGALIMRFRRHRRPPADGMLITEEQTYTGNQVVYCDCFCLEVVLPTGAASAKSANEVETCYAYFRQASDCRRAIPESSLFPLDQELSAWFLKHRHYPRFPIIVCVLGPPRVNSQLSCHVFVTDSVEDGLQFVRTVVDYTYGQQQDYSNAAQLRYGKTDDLASRYPGLDFGGSSKSAPDAKKPATSNGPLRAFQPRRRHFRQSRSKSPSLNHAPLSGKNGRSMLFTPGSTERAFFPREETSVPNLSRRSYHENLDSVNQVEVEQLDDDGDPGLSSDSTEARFYHSGMRDAWLAASTPALLLAPVTEQELEPLRKRILQFQIAHEASDLLRLRSGRSREQLHVADAGRRAKSTGRMDSRSPDRDSACSRPRSRYCSHCNLTEHQRPSYYQPLLLFRPLSGNK